MLLWNEKMRLMHTIWPTKCKVGAMKKMHYLSHRYENQLCVIFRKLRRKRTMDKQINGIIMGKGLMQGRDPMPFFVNLRAKKVAFLLFDLGKYIYFRIRWQCSFSAPSVY